MATLLFDAGNMNAKGVCYAIVCDWIVKCKAGVNVASRYDFDSAWGNENRWNAGDRLMPGGDGIDQMYGLVPSAIAWNKNPPVSTNWIATELTKGTGFFLFSVWGRTLNVSQGKYDESGHAMGTKKGFGKLQYLDPNLGIMEFDNTIEFYQWIPQYLKTTYQDLLTQQAQVKKF
jgi:hypothetical protein